MLIRAYSSVTVVSSASGSTCCSRRSVQSVSAESLPPLQERTTATAGRLDFTLAAVTGAKRWTHHRGAAAIGLSRAPGHVDPANFEEPHDPDSAEDSRRVEASGRALRLWPLPGAPGAARELSRRGCGTDGDLAPAKTDQAARRRDPQRARRAVRASRWLRGRARKRRDDSVLGRGGLLPGARARLAPELWR